MAQKKIYGTVAYQSAGTKRQLYWRCPTKNCQHFFIIEKEMTPAAMRFNEDFKCFKCGCTYNALCHQYTNKSITLLISKLTSGNPQRKYLDENKKNL